MGVVNDSTETERRREICSNCPQLKQGMIKRCGVCGCVIAVITKLNGRCPQRKW